MNRRTKWILLAVLLTAVGLCIAALVGGEPARYISFVPAGYAVTVFRLLIVIFSLCGWFITQSLIASRGCEGDRIGDAVHDWTAPIHGWLMRNPGKADSLLIISSGFIDLFAVFIIAISLFGPSMRPFFALLMLFIFRQLCQMTCALPAPKDMIWRNPGFPSLLVTYGVANDFFISGHTAIAVIGAIEVAKVAPLWLAVAAGVIALLEALTVLVLRAHYTMDILGAIAAAFCAEELASRLCSGM
jgi:hypothetical protein